MGHETAALIREELRTSAELMRAYFNTPKACKLFSCAQCQGGGTCPAAYLPFTVPGLYTQDARSGPRCKYTFDLTDVRHVPLGIGGGGSVFAIAAGLAVKVCARLLQWLHLRSGRMLLRDTCAAPCSDERWGLSTRRSLSGMCMACVALATAGVYALHRVKCTWAMIRPHISVTSTMDWSYQAPVACSSSRHCCSHTRGVQVAEGDPFAEAEPDDIEPPVEEAVLTMLLRGKAHCVQGYHASMMPVFRLRWAHSGVPRERRIVGFDALLTALQPLESAEGVQKLSVKYIANAVAIVMEQTTGDTWLSRLQRPTELTPRDCKHFEKHVSAALQEMHALRILHCDVHPGNVLIADAHSTPGRETNPHTCTAELKLGDLGTAVQLEATEVEVGFGAGETHGTEGYAAPEATFKPHRSERCLYAVPKSDVFSFGVCAQLNYFTMFTRKFRHPDALHGCAFACGSACRHVE